MPKVPIVVRPASKSQKSPLTPRRLPRESFFFPPVTVQFLTKVWKREEKRHTRHGSIEGKKCPKTGVLLAITNIGNPLYNIWRNQARNRRLGDGTESSARNTVAVTVSHRRQVRFEATAPSRVWSPLYASAISGVVSFPWGRLELSESVEDS